jgi:23S rRNA (cytosine1962-C5)-methyltransferase
MVIDKYGHVAVIRLDGAHLVTWLDTLVPPLAKSLAARGVTSLALRRARDEAGDKRTRTLAGVEPPDRLIVYEHGMAMEVDLAHGQKTGAFLDQRDNRALIRSLGKGRTRVLNLYSFAGGFSVAAALGGATHVTSVDVASAAHASAQRSFRENKLDPAKHAFVSADAFAFLDAAARRGDRFDLIVSDPPSFAPNEKTKPRALGAYRKLHAALARVLDRCGILCAASCSSHVTTEEFVGTLDQHTLGRDDLSLVSIHGHAPDHPTLPAWSEGRYLKMVVLAYQFVPRNRLRTNERFRQNPGSRTRGRLSDVGLVVTVVAVVLGAGAATGGGLDGTALVVAAADAEADASGAALSVGAGAAAVSEGVGAGVAAIVADDAGDVMG